MGAGQDRLGRNKTIPEPILDFKNNFQAHPKTIYLNLKLVLLDAR